MMRTIRALSPYFLTLTLVVAIVATTVRLDRWSARAQDNAVATDSTGPATPANSGETTSSDTASNATTSSEAAVEAAINGLYMPSIFNDHNGRLSPRIGFGSSFDPITNVGDVRALNAGWYVDWRVNPNRLRLGGMEYMPMVRVHQKLACPIGTTADRKRCPYLNGYDYQPSAVEIQAYAKANPGSIWLLGNEMDRVDWPGGWQNEMQPTLYPVFYKELYDMIKAVDPTAKVAIGGVIQPTALRLRYLDTILTTYRQLYGVDMPVDVWNIHNFINAEFCHYVKNEVDKKDELVCSGGAVPPDSETLQGWYYGQDWLHISKDIFAKQIRDMRKWMKDRGQQNKPLIVTEYGVLYEKLECIDLTPQRTCPSNPNWVDLENPAVIHDFMLWTFDFFADTADPTIGYPADGNRLVQRWAWFSLEDIYWNEPDQEWRFNVHGALFDPNTRQMTETGRLFSQYTTTNYKKLQ
jgi:hypothetical protein